MRNRHEKQQHTAGTCKSFTHFEHYSGAVSREFVALSPILNIYCRPSELLFIYFFIFTTVLSILLREYSCQKRNPYVTVHPHDESGAASLRYRYRAAIIVLRCEQKAFPVWFSWWCKRSPLSDM